MRYLVLLIAILITGCAPATPTAPPPTATLIPTSTPRPLLFRAPEFVFQGEDPVIPIVTHNPSAAIENLYINPGAVLFHEGRFHMFFNSFTSWPGVIEVGYMTSTDGRGWEMVQDEPVFTTDQIPFGDGEADVSSVLVMDDGTWVMYFHTIGGEEIGRATAPSPLGPWTADPEPVLTAGPQGAWDQYGLGWPSVVRDGEELRMYYGAQTGGGYAISFATSTDGVNWTKYDDPETTDAEHAGSDPVLTTSMDWEYNKVDRPRVVHTPDGWIMIYQGGSIEMRGIALSDDGIHWEKYDGNPIFDSKAFPIPNAKTWDTNLVYQDGTYYYFMEIGTLSGTNLYLTTHAGSLRE